MSLISLFLSSKTRIVGFECSFACRYYCFKTIISTIIRLLSIIFYINSLLTNNSPTTWSYKTRCKSCFLLLFRYCFAIKFYCISFEPNLMWLCKPLNSTLILLFNNLFSLGIPLTNMFIIYPWTLSIGSIIAWFSSTPLTL